MELKSWGNWAVIISAPALAAISTGAIAGTASPDIIANAIHAPLIIELAGGDETDRAKEKRLKDAGVEMVPDKGMKQAKPGASEPTFKKASPKPIPLEKKQPLAKPARMEPKSAPPAPALQDVKPKSVMASAAHSGPYLRLDAAYALSSDPDGTQAAGNMTSETIDNGISMEIGLGYRFGNRLRGDVTLGYRPDTDVSAVTSAGNATSSDVDAMSVMFNGYLDLANLGKFTPYAGAGIGYARLSTSDQTTTGGIATETGDTSDNVAWSMTGGVSVEMSDTTALDMNYRYFNLGEFSQSVSTTYDDLAAHEVRAGLRFNF